MQQPSSTSTCAPSPFSETVRCPMVVSSVTETSAGQSMIISSKSPSSTTVSPSETFFISIFPNPSPVRPNCSSIAPERRSVLSMSVSPITRILTFPSFFVTTSPLRLVFVKVTVDIPPPFIIVSPFTVTSSKVASPSPTPAVTCKSPFIIMFLSVTPSAVTETFPFIVSFPLLGPKVPASLYTVPATLSKRATVSALVIPYAGLRVLSG